MGLQPSATHRRVMAAILKAFGLLMTYRWITDHLQLKWPRTIKDLY